jgi:hypothetical protein
MNEQSVTRTPKLSNAAVTSEPPSGSRTPESVTGVCSSDLLGVPCCLGGSGLLHGESHVSLERRFSREEIDDVCRHNGEALEAMMAWIKANPDKPIRGSAVPLQNPC